jgi:hypothetical protein
VVLLASQDETLYSVPTTHASEVVTQELQTQTGSDHVEANATYTLEG